MEADSFPAELIRKNLADLPIFAGKDLRLWVDQSDLAAEPSECLGKFTPNWSCSEDHQLAGECRAAEDRFIGLIARLLQAGNRGNRRASPGCDNGARKPQPVPTDLNRLTIEKLGLSEVNFDAIGRGQSLDRIVLADPCAHLPHALHHGSKIDHWVLRPSTPKALPVPLVIDRSRRPQDRLGWDTSERQAVSPQQSTLDQGHLPTKHPGSSRTDQACRPRSNHDQIVSP